MLLRLHENCGIEIELRRDEEFGLWNKYSKWNLARNLEILPCVHWVLHPVLKVYGLLVQ